MIFLTYGNDFLAPRGVILPEISLQYMGSRHASRVLRLTHVTRYDRVILHRISFSLRISANNTNTLDN